MSNYVTEDNFVIAEGTEGDLYCFISAKEKHPESPRVIYDGREHAVFLRGNEQKIILDYINPEVRDKLRKSKEIVMVEILVDTVKESYHTPLQLVDKIPVDWSQLGLSTWESMALQG